MKATKDKKKEQNKSTTNVIVIGLSRSGKSSLIRSLTNKDLIISQGTGRKMEFQSDGSQSSSNKPLITSDPNTQLTYIDYPGFEDAEGLSQEKVNLFLKDQSFLKNSKNFKILLTAFASEFEEYNEEGIEKYFDILTKKFSNDDNFKNLIGLVITKGEIDIAGVDYIEQLEDTCSSSLKKWCTYFKSNFDHVFSFPSPQRKNLGKKYEFDDQKRIIQFLQSNSTASNQISVSSSSTDNVKSQSPNFYKVREIVRNIFSDIFIEYRKDKSTSSLRRWLISFQQLQSRNISDPKELKSFFQRNIPNCDQYDEYFQELEKFKDLKSYSDLQETLSASIFEATQEIENLYQQAEMIEKQEEKNNELERREKEQKQNAIDQKRERDEIKSQMEMHRQYSDQQRNLIEMYEQTIAQNAYEIEKLKGNRNHHRGNSHSSHNRNNGNNDNYDNYNNSPRSPSCIIE